MTRPLDGGIKTTDRADRGLREVDAKVKPTKHCVRCGCVIAVKLSLDNGACAFCEKHPDHKNITFHAKPQNKRLTIRLSMVERIAINNIAEKQCITSQSAIKHMIFGIAAHANQPTKKSKWDTTKTPTIIITFTEKEIDAVMYDAKKFKTTQSGYIKQIIDEAINLNAYKEQHGE